MSDWETSGWLEVVYRTEPKNKVSYLRVLLFASCCRYFSEPCIVTTRFIETRWAKKARTNGHRRRRDGSHLSYFDHNKNYHRKICAFKWIFMHLGWYVIFRFGVCKNHRFLLLLWNVYILWPTAIHIRVLLWFWYTSWKTAWKFAQPSFIEIIKVENRSKNVSFLEVFKCC